MGALSEKVKEKHLVLASGNHIYVLDGRRLEPIATRPGRVTGLAVYHDRLVDSGNYSGIYDTVTGERLKFSNLWLGVQKWKDLTSFEGRLVGVAMERLTEDGRRVNYGYRRIFDLIKGVDIRADQYGSGAGTTHLLSSNSRTLAEAGRYKREAGSEVIDTYPGGEIRHYYYSWHSDIRVGDNRFGSCRHLNDVWGAINGLEVIGDWDFLYSDKKRIKKLERPSEGDEIVFHLDKEYSDFLERLDGLVGNDWWGSVRLHMKNLNLHNFLRNWQGSEYLPKNFRELREEKWQEFRGLVFENEEMFPSYILRVVGYQTLDDAVVNCNKGPLRKVDDGGFGPWQEEFHVRNPNHLFNLLRKSVDALEKKYLSSNTMRGLATVGDDIYFGTSKRELHRVVSVAESELITGVPRPVAKMISISLPVFDEGIRQRVLQNKRRRAYFAKRRKKVYKLAA